jgi:hypothetical protein
MDVDEYLQDVLMKAKRRRSGRSPDYEDLKPWRWKQARDEAREAATAEVA